MTILDRLLELECMRIGEASFPHLNELSREEDNEYQRIKSEIEKAIEFQDESMSPDFQQVRIDILGVKT